MESERLISATEARDIINERLRQKLSPSKITRLLQSGEIPSRPSMLDKRKRMIKISDLEHWIEEAKRELGNRAALAFAC